MPVALTVTGGNTTGLSEFVCATAADTVSPPSATSALQNLTCIPMTKYSFVCARGFAGASGETKPDAKDMKTRHDALKRALRLPVDVVGSNVRAIAPALTSPLRKRAPYG